MRVPVLLATAAVVFAGGCGQSSHRRSQAIAPRPDSSRILALVGSWNLTLSERLPDRPLPDDTASITFAVLPPFAQTHVPSLSDSSRFVPTERRLLWGYIATHFPHRGPGPKPARVPHAELLVYPDGDIDLGVRAMAGGLQL